MKISKDQYGLLTIKDFSAVYLLLKGSRLSSFQATIQMGSIAEVSDMIEAVRFKIEQWT